MFDIIKNAPPPETTNRGRKGAYPFDLLEINDAFDAPRDMGQTPEKHDKRQAAIGAAGRFWAKKHNPTAKFTVRLYDEHTVRCHRIA